MEPARWFKARELRLMDGDRELSAEANEALAYLVRRGESPVSVSLIRNTLRKRKSFQREERLDAALAERINDRCVTAINRYLPLGHRFDLHSHPRRFDLHSHPANRDMRA